MNRVRKIFFVLRQLSLREKIGFLFNYGFRRAKFRQQKRNYETVKFLEESHKTGLQIVRAGALNLIESRIGGRTVHVFVRRFTSDFLVYKQILGRHEFQPIVDLFTQKRFVPKSFIDGGANIGLATLYYKSHYPDMPTVVMEPNRGNFAVLKMNIERNGLTNVAMHQKGLWSRSEILVPEDSHGDGMEWSFSLKAGTTADKANAIECMSVSELLTQSGWEEVDYLKLDIEGAEEELFRSEEVYSQFLTKVKVISIEVHDPVMEKKINQILGKNGFSVFKTGELTVGHCL